MSKKYKINFRETETPIIEAVTKFGGQPVWIEKPEWAVSRSTGKPMMFICQIKLEEEIFGQTRGKMAYIFMTDDEQYVDGTWEADGGENAVIIQPEGDNPASIETDSGPTLNIWEEVKGENRRQPFPREFAIEKSDVLFDEKKSNKQLEEEDEDMYENKVGGFPNFLQFEEFPDKNKENWNLLLQLDSSNVPFEINFGDAGVGYAFISKDGKTGKFLWQCG